MNLTTERTEAHLEYRNNGAFKRWSIGVLECWAPIEQSNTPLLHHSNCDFMSDS
jgi:hypothetical protein